MSAQTDNSNIDATEATTESGVVDETANVTADDSGNGETVIGNDSGGRKGGGRKAAKSQGITQESVAAMVQESIQSALAAYAQEQETRQSEAAKLAKMSEAEKLAYERDDAIKKYEELQNRIAMTELQNTARSMLSEKGYHVPDGILSVLVTENAEKTKTNVEAFGEMLEELIADEVTRRMKSEPPKRGASSSSSGMTKADIMKEKDTAKRLKLIQENMELFSQN